MRSIILKNMTRKRVKIIWKSKNKKKNKSNIVDITDDQQTKEHITAQEEPHLLDSSKCANKKDKSAKQVHIAFLPEKYEPLVEDEFVDKPTDDNIKKKQDKQKKFRKNVGKALRFSWKCLVVGLQNFSTAYSMPLSTHVTVVTEIHRPHV